MNIFKSVILFKKCVQYIVFFYKFKDFLNINLVAGLFVNLSNIDK